MVVDTLSLLRDELAFLIKALPELEEAPDLSQLESDFKKRIAKIREQIRQLEGKK